MEASALRMISAISNRGRVTAAVLRRLWRRLRQTRDVDAFERIDRSVQVPPGEMHVQRGVLQLLVPQQKLQRRQVGPAFDEVGCESMPQSMRAEALRQTSPARALHAGVPHGLICDRLLLSRRVAASGEQ